MKTQKNLLDRPGLVEALASAINRKEPSNILLAGPWGSGKTQILEQLREEFQKCSGKDAPHVIWFSPWDTVADGDPRVAFVRVLRDELKQISSRKITDSGLRKRVTRLLHAFSAIVDSPSFQGGLAISLPIMGVVTPLAGGLAKLTAALLENAEASTDDESAIERMRIGVWQLLCDIARGNNKERILLLVDDLDRARPNEAVAVLDTLYHLFMPQNGEQEADWPLTSVWAVNTSVLEEFLYREYRELPSFDPNAYLEKLFRQRINVPPLFHFGNREDGPVTLWEADLGPHCAHFSRLKTLVPELARALANEVNYAILGNLRLHARVRRDCIRFWCQDQEASAKQQDITLASLVREARLIVLVDAFPYFREQIAPFNGMWPHFLNQLNQRLTDRPMEWIANPLYRHVDSPDLATLLCDLGVLRYDYERKGYELNQEGRLRLQNDLNTLWERGV